MSNEYFTDVAEKHQLGSLLPSKVYGNPPVENTMRKICILVPLLLLLPPVCGNLRSETIIHYTDGKTWEGAQRHCRNNHTDLVTIANEKENRYFVNRQGWIGLRRSIRTEKWMWSKGDEIANFTSWKPLELQNGFGRCAFKYLNTYEWERDPCFTQHSYLCYDERLVLVKENKTWEEALMHCRALEAVDQSKPATAYQNYRYDLATLLTPDDHVFAQEKAQGATTDEVWTGLRYLAGHWVWVGGGEEVQYKNIRGCPTQRFCGTLSKNGTKPFDISLCMQKKNFLCYKKP